jgi:uncharacterized protein (UPF0261 family)
MPTVAILGTFDTKGEEHAFLAELIRRQGCTPLLINAGCLEAPRIKPDISAETLAEAADPAWREVFARRDRGECVALMARGAAKTIAGLAERGLIHGIVSLGGGGGTAIATAAMRALPIGFPKVMVSTLASGNVAPYVGTTDIVMIPAIVDVSGINRVSRIIFENAAGAICGMVAAAERRGAARPRPVAGAEARPVAETEARTDSDREARTGRAPTADPATDKPLVVASMFGNTTACVSEAKRLVEAAGYEVLVFHATGTGGRALEALVGSGLAAGVLDITTTEWADELVGGILGAGPERLDAAGKARVPAIVTPGCLDMVNFGERATVPAKFAGRLFYQHNPQVTLMRTTPAECAELGRILAEKINRYTAPVTVLLPLKGISIISAPGGVFHDPAADAALFGAIRQHLRADIPRVELDVAINDPIFARACAEALLGHLARGAREG